MIELCYNTANKKGDFLYVFVGPDTRDLRIARGLS